MPPAIVLPPRHAHAGARLPRVDTPTARRGEHRYGVVLGLVLASVVFQIAAPETDWARLVTIGLGAVTVMAAVHMAGAHRAVVRAGATLAGVVTAGSLVYLLAAGEVPEAVSAVVNGLLVAVAPATVAAGVLRQLRAEREVNFHTLGGVLAIYLLIGMFFSFCYGAIDRIESGHLFAQTAHATRSDELYFSFVTLSTVGFGDLTAESELARTVAITEALLGQIYLVTVVALIVGALAAQRRG
jgi:hypothetical protein